MPNLQVSERAEVAWGKRGSVSWSEGLLHRPWLHLGGDLIVPMLKVFCTTDLIFVCTWAQDEPPEVLQPRRASIRFEEITRVQDAYWKMRSKDAHHTINP
jgi:hypothetical protein